MGRTHVPNLLSHFLVLFHSFPWIFNRACLHRFFIYLHTLHPSIYKQNFLRAIFKKKRTVVCIDVGGRRFAGSSHMSGSCTRIESDSAFIEAFRSTYRAYNILCFLHNLYLLLHIYFISISSSPSRA